MSKEQENRYRKERYNKLGYTYTQWQTYWQPLIMDIKGRVCEDCGATKRIDVHHMDYNNVNIHTLKIVCRSCHKKNYHKK